MSGDWIHITAAVLLFRDGIKGTLKFPLVVAFNGFLVPVAVGSLLFLGLLPCFFRTIDAVVLDSRLAFI